jgi:predicted transcriptional regulator
MSIEYTQWQAWGKVRDVPDPAWLRRIRREAGLSTASVAAMVGCNYQYIQQVETGRRPCPLGIARSYEVICERRGSENDLGH